MDVQNDIRLTEFRQLKEEIKERDTGGSFVVE